MASTTLSTRRPAFMLVADWFVISVRNVHFKLMASLRALSIISVKQVIYYLLFYTVMFHKCSEIDELKMGG